MNRQCLKWRAWTQAVQVVVLACAACVSSQARAQSWLPDRAYTEGPGIRTGNLEIHPGVAVRGGYDTNTYRADGDPHTALVDGELVNVTQRKVGSGILAVTPHINISTLTRQRLEGGEDHENAEGFRPPIAFRGGASTTYLHYFNRNAPKNLEIDTAFWLGILPDRPLNIDLNVDYSRNIRPFTQYADKSNAYNVNYVYPRVRFNFGSASKVLTGYIGYGPRLRLYESDVFDYLNNYAHSVEVGAAWRFLPNTALVYDAGFDRQIYSEDAPAETRSPVVYSNGNKFRTRLGVNGAFTPALALRLFAGYALVQLNGTTGSEILDDHEDVIGEAVLTWRLGTNQKNRLELGYQRDLQASSLGGWVRLDRGFLSLTAMLGRAFQLGLEGGAAYISYGSLWGIDPDTSAIVPLGTNGRTDRNDVRVDGAVRGEYRITNWLSLMADFTVQAVITDFDYNLLFADEQVPDPADYVTMMVFGGVRVHY